MAMKAQDVLVALKLSLVGERPRYADLAAALGLSGSEVHAAVRRLADARLLDPETGQVRGGALHEFLVHGLPYVFPARPGEVTRGVPTAWAIPVLAESLLEVDGLPPVWPDPAGSSRGVAVEPLYPSVPGAARRDPVLHELLALVDALRLGRARERVRAEDLLARRLQPDAGA